MNRYILGAITFLGLIALFNIEQSFYRKNSESIFQRIISNNISAAISIHLNEARRNNILDIQAIQPTARVTAVIQNPEAIPEDNINQAPDSLEIIDEKTSRRDRSFRFYDNLPIPGFTMFTWAESLIFFAFIAILVVIVLWISSQVGNAINKKHEKPIRRIGYALVFIVAVIMISSFQENRDSLIENPEAINNQQILFSEFFRLLEENSEDFPPPFNNPVAAFLIVLYVLGFAILIRLAVLLLFSGIRGLSPRQDKEINRLFAGASVKGVNKKPEFLKQYYKNNISQTIQSFYLSLVLIIVGIVLIFLGVWTSISRADGDDAVQSNTVLIITGISGVVLEFVGGTALLLFRVNLRYSRLCFNALVKDQNFLRAVQVSKDLKGIERSEFTQASKIIITGLVNDEPLSTLPEPLPLKATERKSNSTEPLEDE